MRDRGEDTPVVDPPRYPGTPRWAKVFLIIALVVVPLFVGLLLTRGPGGHAPARHMPSGATGGHASPGTGHR